jgi:hypothetical protein
MFSKNKNKTKKTIDIQNITKTKKQHNVLKNINFKEFTFKKTSAKSKLKPKTIKQLCEVYKKNITGKVNTPLYNSCKINQYCRKYKCRNIDKKFKDSQTTKLGINYNTLLLSSLHNKCPSTMPDKNRKRCYNSTMLKFYKDNNLLSDYKKVLECDKKICAKEKEIFNTNLFRIRNKGKKQIRIHKPLNIEELPDKEMIEIN